MSLTPAQLGALAPCARHPRCWQELSALPPSPTSSHLLCSQSLWGCFCSQRLMPLLKPQPQLAMPLHMEGKLTQSLSFLHVLFPTAIKKQRGSKYGGRKNGIQIMDFPWKISNLFYIPLLGKNWSILYSLSTLTRLLVLIKNNYNLEEIEIASRFFSFPLRS